MARWLFDFVADSIDQSLVIPFAFSAWCYRARYILYAWVQSFDTQSSSQWSNQGARGGRSQSETFTALIRQYFTDTQLDWPAEPLEPVGFGQSNNSSLQTPRHWGHHLLLLITMKRVESHCKLEMGSDALWRKDRMVMRLRTVVLDIYSSGPVSDESLEKHTKAWHLLNSSRPVVDTSPSLSGLK